MQIKEYRKKIVQGRAFLIMSVLFAILVRVLYITLSEDRAGYVVPQGGYVWNLIAPIFENRIYSLIASSLCVAAIAILLSFINAKYILIRQKTVLIIVFTILLFSCHPVFLEMGPYYFVALFLLWAIYDLYQSYQEVGNKGYVCANISFILALGSLFAPSVFIYLLVFWIGFSMMRVFSVKGFFSSFIGILVIYLPALSIYYFLGELDQFYAPFLSVTVDTLAQLPLLTFTQSSWVSFGIIFLFLLIIIIDNYINSYKDKIKVRSFISFLVIIATFSVLCRTLLNIDPDLNIYIGAMVGSALLAHYFGLVEKKISVFLFYFCIICYLAICYISYFLK